MKQTSIVIVLQTCSAWVMVAAATLAGAQTPSPAPIAPTPPTTPAADSAAAPDADHIGYLFGLTFGEQMHGVGITDQVTTEAIARGLKDGLEGKRITPADRQQVQEFVPSVMEATVA